MADVKEKWDEVGNRFAALGQRVKDQFDARSAFGEEEKAEVESALRRLGDALDNAFNAIGDTMRDPGIRDELKGIAVAMGEAMSTTFREVADEIDQRIKRSSSS